MNFKSKLIFALMILTLFTIGAVSASENITDELSVNQASEIESVSFEETVQASETSVLKADEYYDVYNAVDETSNSDYEDSYQLTKTNIKSQEILSSSNDEEVLGNVIHVADNYLGDLNDAINSAQDGDIIDLEGRTINGVININANKNITLTNGNLVGNGKNWINFERFTLENLTFKNFSGSSLTYCTLNNVSYDNIKSNSFWAIFYCVNNIFNHVNFTNCANFKPQRSDGDFETGVMMVSYYCNFYNCNFINCSSNTHSGAICVAGRQNNIADIINCTFENCTSGVGGAIYLHGTGLTESYHSNIINSTFKNCHATEWGGAIGTSQDYLNVENCEFYDNTAKQGAAIMVGGISHGLDGHNEQGHHDTFKNCHFYNNTGTEEGGAMHITGNYNTAISCTFDDNFAVNGKGAAIYVEGEHASVIDSQFTNHESEMGTVYVEGNYFNCTDSYFENNVASHGGSGVYVEGNYTLISHSQFRNNNASQHGGAIHTIGNNARILYSTFNGNNAIPSVLNDPEYGLGGAIYIDGRDNEISYSKFKHNTARNGSAIYNRGKDLVLNDDTFENNQAWSYFLFTHAQPNETYWAEDNEFKIEATLVGGDNLINAIYNDRDVYEIYFHNVTYTLKPNDLYPTGIKTTDDNEIHPVDGIENSHGGLYLYQDAHEDDQLVNINITYGDGKIFEYSGKTDMHGTVSLTITKENVTEKEFRPGLYTVNAEHPSDDWYTHITNSTTFRILPHVDVSVTKTSDKNVYVLGENAIFTIIVSGVGTNATNVTVKDILPESFRYISATATQGSYNSTTNEWYVGFLPHGASQTLTLTVQTTELGTYDNVVNVTCTEKDWNLSNNIANKTIHVDIYYTKEASVTNTSAGQYIEYYLRVFNTGDEDYTDTIRIRDIFPEGIRYTGEYELVGGDLEKYISYGFEQIWEITNISAKTLAKITVKAEAVKDGIWNNTMTVWDYPSVNSTVNVTSNADLHIIKDVSSPVVDKNGLVTWKIIVINHGPSIAFGVYVKDLIPTEYLAIVERAYPEAGTTYDRISGIWDIGTMGVEEIKTLNITTRVLVSNTNITNEATVNSSTPDPNPDNNYDNATTTSNPEGDVGVVKTVSNHNSNHEDVISWTIVVTNYGPDTATGVFVTDVLPSTGLQFINSSETKGKKYNPVTGVWTIGDLENGESANLTIWTRVTTHDVIINNVAVVNSTSVDTNPNNNRDDDFTIVGPEADLELIKTVDKSEVIKGDIVTWTITVYNKGPNDARDVLVNDTLPEGLIYIDCNSRRYNPTTGIWDIGHLSNGANVSIKIRTRINASNAIINNYAIVNSTTYDPDLTNNDDDEDVIVKTEADVGVVKIVSNKTSHYGDTVIWTIVVTNYGPNTAENVILTDFIPEGLIVQGSPAHSVGHVYVDSNGRGIWNIGNLENGTTVTCEMITVINITGTSIVNVVNVNTTSHDPDLSNNNAENRTTVPTECDVGVVKKVDNLTPNKYDTVTWTITVVNHGPDVAKDVIITDVLPDGLEYVSNGVPTLGSYSHNRNTWTIGELDVEERHTLTITTRVVDTGKITNEVNVTTSTYDTNPDNNYDNETIDVPAIADLQITKLVSNKTSKKGDLITWTIIVYNAGPNNARNVVVTDKLPTGLIYDTHNASTGLYDPVQGIWQIGDLLHFETVNLTITSRVNITNATIMNVAVVSSTTPDNNESNNRANNTTVVGALADLAINKTVDNHSPRNGDNITWIITVVNNGPDNAINVKAEDILPAGLKFVNATGNGTYNNESNIWTIGNLKNGEKAVLYIVTTVTVSKQVITNTANVTSDTPDPDLTNNEDNSTIDIGHEADLKVVKTVSNSTPKYGDEITWNITVTNLGPDTAVEVFVKDELPKGLVFINATGKGTYDSNEGIWTIGNLDKDASVTLIITTLVNVTGANITNVAVVDSDTYDPNETNNKDNDTINVRYEADLWLVKYVSVDNATFGDTVIWEIHVMNLGPNTAAGAYVNDVLPYGLIYDDYRATKGSYDNATGIWEIGDMPSGDYQVLYIWTIVNKTTGNITNVAVVNSTTPDKNPDNNKDNDTFNVIPIADLEIIKIVSDKNPHKGDEITWTIIVKNNGPSDASNVTVTDKLPEGLIYKTDDSEGKYNSTTGIWKIGDLAYNETRKLVITTIVNITNATITNIAVVNSTTTDNNTGNNKANNTTNVDPEADLEIIKIVSNKTSKFGDEITWTIVVTNKGPDVASEVYVVDKFPAEYLIYNGYSKTKGLFDSETFTWYIKSLAKGESQNLTIKAIVNFTNITITNVANVTSETYDPNETNNKANNTTVVSNKANLLVVKEVSKKNVTFGETITWTITVTNAGPDTAVNVKVNDTLPKGLIFVSSDGDYDNATGIWNVGDLTLGQSKSLVITTVVNITNTTILNVANATSDTPGNSTPGNNTTDVAPKANLVVVKEVSKKNVTIGEIITWTITVTNNGPDTALNVRVNETLPAGLVYQTHSGDGTYDNVHGIWIVGDMAKGDSRTLVITTLVNVTNTNITNIANATSDTPGNSTPGNNTTNVAPKANLVVVKEVSKKNVTFGEEITWTIRVTNKGPDTAVNVNVTDKLPKGLIFISSDGDYDNATGIWKVGNLTVGQTGVLKIITKVNITNTTILNVANATSDTPGNSTPGNNTTDVEPIADLEIIKLVSNKTAKKGEVITWTIIVTNKGPDMAVNIKVYDKLPKELIYNGHNAEVGTYDPSVGLWSFSNLTANKPVKLYIYTIVNATNKTVLNVANVTSDTPDNNTDNNKGNNTTTVDDNADLIIIKVVSNKNPKFGETITWTITVTNNGPSDAKNVVVVDKLPAGLIFVKSDGNYNNATGVWNVGDLAYKANAVLVITTLVNITNKTITNVANVTSDTPDGNKTNNEANNTTDVGPEADIVITKAVSDKNPHKGDTITWTITVINKGPDTAVNVKVTDKLPEGLIFVTSDGDYNKDTGVWNVGNLTKDEPKVLVITTLVNITNTTIRNVANVTSETYDPNKTNNEANNTTNVDPEADLEIIKIVSDKTSNKGDIITWTIVVTNKGPDTAVNVYVTDLMPSSLDIRGYKNKVGLFDQNKKQWYIPRLKSGESQNLTIYTYVNASNTVILNKVNVTSDTYDPNETNNEANNTTNVGKESDADLEVIKVVSDKNPHKGDTITWTITVINHGPGTSRDVKVTDKLPDGLKFVSSDGNYDASTGIWTIGDMANGAKATLNIRTLVTLTNINITNIVVVSSSTPDNNTDNNKANNTTNVDPEADLKIVKTVSNPKPSKGDKITWTIVVVNLGPDAAKDVVVIEELPEGLKLISAKGSKGTFTDGIWTIGTLDNGEIATLTITTQVLLESGTIENIVVVNSSTYDPDKTNNRDKEVTTPTNKTENNPDDPDDDEGDDTPEDDENEDTPDEQPVPGKKPPVSTSKMHATGNPIIMVLLALLAVCGASLKRKF